MKAMKLHSAESSHQLYIELQKILRIMNFGNNALEKKRTLTVAQMRVLSFFNERKVIYVSDISRSLNMSIQNTNNIVRRLEDAGIVTRTPNKKDKRFTDIKLTPAGKRKFAAFRSVQLKTLSNLLNHIKPKDTDILLSTIKESTKIMEKASLKTDKSD